jgi:DNA N-6-adenine-methyltransferase Dam
MGARPYPILNNPAAFRSPSSGGISGGTEWYTPPEIFAAMGNPQFDLDVASPGADIVPWIPATRHLTKVEDGLRTDWEGFAWMNCPYGKRNGVDKWVNKFVQHRNGVAILPDFTTTRWWHRATDEADLIMFVRPRIYFLPRYTGRTNSLGSTLVAMGERGVLALLTAELNRRGKCFWRKPG